MQKIRLLGLSLIFLSVVAVFNLPVIFSADAETAKAVTNTGPVDVPASDISKGVNENHGAITPAPTATFTPIP